MLEGEFGLSTELGRAHAEHQWVFTDTTAYMDMGMEAFVGLDETQLKNFFVTHWREMVMHLRGEKLIAQIARDGYLM